jgi:putative endopeptidase
MTRLWPAATALAAIMFAACGIGHSTAAEAPTSGTAPHFGPWGFDLTAMDPSVKPGTDFYLYANGNWLKRTKLPPDKSRVGHFNELNDQAQLAIRKLIEEAAAGHSTDRDAGRIGAAYRAFMDEARVEQLDAKPLAPALARIRAEASKADVAALMGAQHTTGQSSIFGVSEETDDKAPTRYVIKLSTLGSGLPDRDYYLKPEFADKRAKYQSYVATMLRMIGWSDPDGNAKAIVAFETALAEARWTRAETRDPVKTYNPMTVPQLSSYAPGFDFGKFFGSAGLGSLDRVIVRTNTAFPKFTRIFDSTPLDTLKAWQAFHLASSAAPLLSSRFVAANFDFYSKTISGVTEMQPRWKRAVNFVNAAMPEAIGRIYVAAYFPPAAKAKVDALVKQIIAAMHARLDRVTWMSPETKQKAHHKLSKMAIKIGYPAKWRSYDTLTMSADDLYGDATRAGAFQWDFLVKRLNQPVDRDEWQMNPQEVNAGYDPDANDITFPAAILQPPFFNPNADTAVNYGAIGAVIGHEITHGFDDQGRHFDAEGKLAEWWTPQDAASFKSRTDRLAAEFDKFEPVKSFFVNGQLTMGENIADLGGLLLALDAYHASLHGKEAPVLNSFTGDQRFFLGNAQVWQEKSTEQGLIVQIKTNPHSPSHFRIDGPYRNIDGWYSAFHIVPGDPMYTAPEDRVRIW